MDSPDKIWHLIARALNGEASSRELEELMEVLRQEESLQQQYDLLTRIWKEKEGHIEKEDNDAARKTISRIIDKAELEGRHIEPPVRKSRMNRRRMWLAAACIAVLLFAGWFLKRSQSPAKETKQEALEARNGSRSRSLLPDGTTVWLNAGSKLYYENDFSGATREVRLEGEAFFDVVKDPAHPFIIHTTAIDIKVLGTTFNVKAYPGDKTTETSLIRGSIEVSIKSRPADKIILLPDEKLVIENQPEPDSIVEKNNREPLVVINKLKRDPRDSTIAETQWTENKLVFDDEPFRDIAVKMERWYNVEIEIKDSLLNEKRLTGNFEKESIGQALEALTITNSFSFERKGNKIIIHH